MATPAARVAPLADAITGSDHRSNSIIGSRTLRSHQKKADAQMAKTAAKISGCERTDPPASGLMARSRAVTPRLNSPAPT